jgi:peptide chain release factor 2
LTVQSCNSASTASGLGSKRWGGIFDLPKRKARLAEIDELSSAPDFWNDTAKAREISREKSRVEAEVGRAGKLMGGLADAGALLELFAESGEAGLGQECEAELDRLEHECRDIELAKMLKGAHDSQNAILEINPGAGGTEAQDWGEILLRMYLRWAEKQGFEREIVNIQPGEGAGIKNATVLIEGENAFGFLRSERGVHRLVRISPFDSNARRHTSFASVAVMPDIEEDVEIEVRDDDLRIDTYRSSGAGGQHVNKTDSAVRITHLPTGIVVACQNERSQHKNKDRAMKLLKAKLYDREMEKKREELEKIAGERRKIDFGSQIRSYVMQPYQLVKDLRTGMESGNIQAVLDGDLNAFVEAYLMSDEHNVA